MFPKTFCFCIFWQIHSEWFCALPILRVQILAESSIANTRSPKWEFATDNPWTELVLWSRGKLFTEFVLKVGSCIVREFCKIQVDFFVNKSHFSFCKCVIITIYNACGSKSKLIGFQAGWQTKVNNLQHVLLNRTDTKMTSLSSTPQILHFLIQF